MQNGLGAALEPQQQHEVQLAQEKVLRRLQRVAAIADEAETAAKTLCSARAAPTSPDGSSGVAPVGRLS